MGKSYCFIGHRNVEMTKEEMDNLYKIILTTVVDDNVTDFLFGSKSEFNNICLNIVSKIKEKYTYINRIYVRAEYEYINDYYRKTVLKDFEETYYPEQIRYSGKAVYIKRNYEMINRSDICIFYYDDDYRVKNTNSGTMLAYKYAKTGNKKIINIKQCNKC